MIPGAVVGSRGHCHVKIATGAERIDSRSQTTKRVAPTETMVSTIYSPSPPKLAPSEQDNFGWLLHMQNQSDSQV